MPAYSFMSPFIPAMLAGTKPHTIRALRTDGYVPAPGAPFSAYYGQRSKQCAWLFDSTVVKVEAILIARPPPPSQRLDSKRPYRHGLHVEIMDRDLYDQDLEAFATADGFTNVKGFRRHFLPKSDSHTFLGFLIHWNPEDAKAQALRHACRVCHHPLVWRTSISAFTCPCRTSATDGYRRHYPKRPA